MKTLFLMRHAKSSWDDPSLSDFERPLNVRGLAAAPYMGAFLRTRGFLPELIVSSPAVRALETARMVAAELNCLVDTDAAIYEASPHALRGVVAGLDLYLTSAMLVGHNPGMEGFLRYLTGELQPMPTAAVAVIDLNIDRWSEIDLDSGKVREIFRAKEIQAGDI